MNIWLPNIPLRNDFPRACFTRDTLEKVCDRHQSDDLQSVLTKTVEYSLRVLA